MANRFASLLVTTVACLVLPAIAPAQDAPPPKTTTEGV